MDWKQLRFDLKQALQEINIFDIYLIDVDNKVLTICVVVDCMEDTPYVEKVQIIDSLIEQNNPDLHIQYLFSYEIWNKKDWFMQPVDKVLHR